MWDMRALSDDAAKSSVVLDRELDQEKGLDPSGPRIRCPLCGWSPRKDDSWSCICGHEWNTFDTGESAPRVSTSGLPHNASRAPDGRYTPSGIRTEKTGGAQMTAIHWHRMLNVSKVLLLLSSSQRSWCGSDC